MALALRFREPAGASPGPEFVSIVRSFIVAFRSAKEWKNATFAERKATLVFRTMLSYVA